MLKTAKRLTLLFAFATSFVMLSHGKDDDDKNYKYDECIRPDGTKSAYCRANANCDCAAAANCAY